MLQECEKIRTGAIEREPPPDLPEPPALFSARLSAEGHWSYRPGQKKDKGRTFTEEERDEFLEGRPDLEEVTEAEVSQENGIHIIGD